MSKSILASKTIWVNVLTIATVVAAQYGITPDPELADKVATFMILANPIINLVLRYFTKKEVVILPAT